MKRTWTAKRNWIAGLLAVAMLIGFGSYGTLRASAQGSGAMGQMDHPMATQNKADNAKEQGKKVELNAEVLDLSCYTMEGAHGDGHKACALDCLKNGAPVGLLSQDGKVYVVTNHGDDAVVKKLRGMAAQTVKIDGTAYKRGGLQAIIVSSVNGDKGDMNMGDMMKGDNKM